MLQIQYFSGMDGVSNTTNLSRNFKVSSQLNQTESPAAARSLGSEYNPRRNVCKLEGGTMYQDTNLMQTFRPEDIFLSLKARLRLIRKDIYTEDEAAASKNAARLIEQTQDL